MLQGGESETKPLKRLHGFFWASSSLTRSTPITFTIHFANPFTLSSFSFSFDILKRKAGLVEEGSCFDFFVQSAAGQIYTNVLMACTSIGHHPIIATSTVWSKFSTSLRCIITRVGDKTTAFSKLLTYIDQSVINIHTAPTSVLHPTDT